MGPQTAMATGTTSAVIPWEIARQRPDSFAEALSGGRYVNYDHVWYITNQIMRALHNPRGGRLIVNLGPGTGKSTLVSKWLPAWYLSTFPANRVIESTATQPLATSWGKAVRETLTEYQDVLGIRLDESSKAKNEWVTEQGGGMRAVGAGVALMGYRANLFIVDDPYGSWDDAWSATYRQGVEDWFDATLNSRLEPNATVIVLHHRLHPRDLTWYLTESGRGERWEVVRLPSLAEANDPLGRAPGQAICPQRFDEEALRRRERVNRVVFDAMDQQNPQGAGIGAAYPNFGQWNIDAGLAFDRRHPLMVAIDFNVNPGMHVELGHYDAGADTFRFVGEIHGPRMNLGQAMDDLEKIVKRHTFPEVHIFGDASGNASKIDDGASLWDVVRQRMDRAGIKWRKRVPASNPGVIARALAVNDALKDGDGKPRVLIHPSCERLLADLRESRLDKEGRPEEGTGPIGHAVVAAGYQIHYLRPVGGRINIPQGRYVMAR